MGVYIKGMEMPASCGDCKAFVCYKQWAGDMGARYDGRGTGNATSVRSTG